MKTKSFIKKVKEKASEVSESIKEDSKEEPKKVEEPKEDRSAFNCKECKGEGLESQTKLCAACNGTGKV